MKARSARTACCPETHLASRMLVHPLSWYSRHSLMPLVWEAPRMENAVERGLDWAGLPGIATVARLLCHTGRIRGAPRPLTPSRGVAGVGRPQAGFAGG